MMGMEYWKCNQWKSSHLIIYNIMEKISNLTCISTNMFGRGFFFIFLCQIHMFVGGGGGGKMRVRVGENEGEKNHGRVSIK